MHNHRIENAARMSAWLALRPHLREDAMPWRDALTLQKLARAIHKLDEAACSGVPDGSEARHERRLERALSDARAISARYGLRAYHQSDPRGWPLHLIPNHNPPAEDSSTYSGRGFAVCPR